MTLVALANALLGDRMVARFHADPRVQATELLLQERVPRGVAPIEPRPSDEMHVAGPVSSVPARSFRTPHTVAPAHAVPVERPLRHLADQRRRRGQRLARPAGDALAPRRHPRRRRPVRLPARRAQRRRCGRPPTSPRGCEPDEYVVTFSSERATFRRRDDDISTVLDVAVSTEDDVEVRRLTVRNHGTRIREIDVTSYAEIVLTAAAADLAHPAFGKLFVETEYLADSAALLCRRRPRGPDESGAWAVPHAQPRAARRQGPLEWETDRARFLGRGRTTGAPAGARRTRALGHHRHRARSDRQPAPAHPACRRAPPCACPSPPAWPPTARRPWPWRASTTTRAPPPAPSRWP